MNKYLERLLKEWRKHGKIIIGLDFDSTIKPWPTIDNSLDMRRCVILVKLAVETGAYVVIHTASQPDRYPEITAYCEEKGIKIDTINKNVFADFPYGHDHKPFCNIYLDDRAGFVESLNMLEKAIYIIRGEREAAKINEQTMP